MVIRDIDEVEIVLYTVPLTVRGYYTPEEPQVMYFKDGSGHPGSPAEFDIIAVYAGGVNINGVLNDPAMEEIEAVILKDLSV